MTNILIDKVTKENIELLKYYVQNSNVIYSNIQLPTKKYQHKKPSDLKNAIVFFDDKNLVEKHKRLLKHINPDKIYIKNKLYYNNNKNLIKKSTSSNSTIPEKLPTVRTPNGAELRPYQARAMQFFLKNKRTGLFIDMGLGKTLTTLASLDYLFKNQLINEKKVVLVVAPITVALDTWVSEAEKWGYDIDTKVCVKITPKKRDQLLKSTININKPTILTCNPEQLKHIVNFYGTNYFDVVIVDEMTLFKNTKSKRFEFLKMLTQNVKYMAGLTGTPAPSSFMDLYGQLNIINPNATQRYLGSDFFVFRDKYFIPSIVHPLTKQVFKYSAKNGAIDQIKEAIKPYTIAMRTDDYLTLPDIIYVNKMVELNKKDLKLYTKMANEVKQALRDAEEEKYSNKESVNSLGLSVNAGDHELIIQNRGALKNKLLQLASGAIYTTNNDYVTYHDEKFKVLKEIVESANSPLLVFYRFKSDIDRMSKYIDFETIPKDAEGIRDVIKRWNNKEIPVLVTSPKTASRGLNIQDGGHTIIWFNIPPGENELYRQANKRLHRSGQKNTVTVMHLITKGTDELEILNQLNQAEAEQQELMKSLGENS